MATGLNRELLPATARPQSGLFRVPRWFERLFVATIAAVAFAVQEHRVAARLVMAQVIVSIVLCNAAGRPVIVGIGDAVITIWGAAFFFGLMALAVALVRRRPAGIPARAAYRIASRRLWTESFSASWLASVLFVLVILPISLDVFSAAKRAIPAVHPFDWDTRIDLLGAWIHGGHRPWELLQPVLGHPWITRLADDYYHLGWALLILGAQGLAIVAAPSELRRRYITASILVWFVVGTIGATLFSSAGPTYYGHVVSGPNPYAGLVSYLDSVDRVTPLLSRGGQRSLWHVYEHGGDVFGFGVSAMPSVHIATATLLACLCFSIRRWMGVAATLGAVLMFVCSVILGWHYAVDGYAGAIMAIGLWWIAGRMERSITLARLADPPSV